LAIPLAWLRRWLGMRPAERKGHAPGGVPAQTLRG
jgi:hypothetical protein